MHYLDNLMIIREMIIFVMTHILRFCTLCKIYKNDYRRIVFRHLGPIPLTSVKGFTSVVVLIASLVCRKGRRNN